MTVPGTGHCAENMGKTGASVRALSAADIRRLGTLARLELNDSQVEKYQLQLSAVLGHMERLRAIDVSATAPMSHPGGGVNRLEQDVQRVPSDVLPAEALMRIAPETVDGFVSVPKVIGDGGGA